MGKSRKRKQFADVSLQRPLLNLNAIKVPTLIGIECSGFLVFISIITLVIMIIYISLCTAAYIKTTANTDAIRHLAYVVKWKKSP